jgi:alanine racemase
VRSNSGISASVDLAVVRQNIQAIAARVQVPIIAVVKSDGYGLGARHIAETIGDLIEKFCVFQLHEAMNASLWEIAHKPVLVLGPDFDATASDYLAAHAHPAVWDSVRASNLRATNPVLCVDTGMQRFACPAAEIDSVIAAGGITEAFTHAANLNHVQKLKDITRGRNLRLHAAASALLDEPEACLDAVRPGLALYRGAARISARLVEAKDSNGPIGYRGFSTQRFGVILCGYSNGLRIGPCSVNGMRRQVLEVGMQSAYVEIGPNDRVGDEVILLGDGITEADLASAWQCTEHQVLVHLVGGATRRGQTQWKS